MQEKTRTRNPGNDIPLPNKSCNDINCPFHSSLKLRGKTFIGVVISDKMQKSVVVSWEGRRFVPKFERYKKTRTRISAHNPECINAKEGDKVMVRECRPLSKMISAVVVQILGQEDDYIIEKRLEEEGKHKFKKKEIANKEAEAEKAKNEKSEE